MKNNIKRRLIGAWVGILLLGTATPVFAGMSERLEGHWSKGVLKEKTVTEFFPTKAAEDFAKLLPKQEMMRTEVVDALNLLYKKYGKTLLENPESTELMKRGDIIPLLAPAFRTKENTLPTANINLTFEDIKGMAQDRLELLQLLVERKILNGISKTLFAPDRVMTQSEVMITVQRLAQMLDREKTETQLQTGKELKFRLVGQSQSYNDSEGFFFRETEDAVRLSLIKRFPTPGYSLQVDKILAGTKGLLVQWHADAPAPDLMLAQVITYQTLTVEIPKSELPKGTPLEFFVDGFERNDI